MSRGFTLIELASVMVVVSIMAIAAAPVLSRVSETRRDALAGEVERMLSLARSRALASGVPAGVRFDTDAQTLEMLERRGDDAPRAFMEAYRVAERLSGVRLVGFENEERTDSVWFMPDATPHARTDAGAWLVAITEPAVVTLERGVTVRVEPNSGRIVR
ncbi:MAG: prepilin-type N-terminal cleavage/methylation domain-containing protein [Planctomycetota bacterium]